MKIFLNIQFEHVPRALTNTLMHLIDVRIFLASKINVPNEAVDVQIVNRTLRDTQRIFS